MTCPGMTVHFSRIPKITSFLLNGAFNGFRSLWPGKGHLQHCFVDSKLFYFWNCYKIVTVKFTVRQEILQLPFYIPICLQSQLIRREVEVNDFRQFMQTFFLFEFEIAEWENKARQDVIYEQPSTKIKNFLFVLFCVYKMRGLNKQHKKLFQSKQSSIEKIRLDDFV